MNTLILYDVPRKAARGRLESLLRAHGFVWLFPNARWSYRPLAHHAALVRAIRGRLRGEPYRMILIEVTADKRASARWVVADPPRGQP